MLFYVHTVEMSKLRERRNNSKSHQWSCEDSLEHCLLMNHLTRLRPLPTVLGAIKAHLVLQLLSAALHCAAQAALLGLLLVSTLSIADGDFGFVSWGRAGVPHQTLRNPGFTLKC